MSELHRDDELQQHGANVAATIMDLIADWQNNSARTLQSTMRVLGMSELGGCREYIRASIAGDEKWPGESPKKLKWAAAIGTWVGDGAEKAVLSRIEGAKQQEKVTVRLPNSGIEISGSADLVLDDVIDFKTRDRLDDVAKEGPKLKEKIQISGYLIAEVDSGRLPDTAKGILMYLDRSGKQDYALTWTVDVPGARDYLTQADERLEDVTHAILTGQRAQRDEPEQWCWYIECPFYKACWTDFIPTDEITHPDQIAAVEKYVLGRDMAKEAEGLQRAAKEILNPDPEHRVVGATPDHTIDWTSRATSSGLIVDTISVRKRRTPPPKETPSDTPEA